MFKVVTRAGQQESKGRAAVGLIRCWHRMREERSKPHPTSTQIVRPATKTATTASRIASVV
jgi:hypothetical protein